MLAPLDNQTIFKKAFTDKEVFEQFVKDLFGVEVNVSNIETEKQFDPPISNIDIRLDIYAESDDHRFLIEIQKIDYDYNFNRFLNYFVSLLIEQQKQASKYAIPQTVLGVIIITQPYKIKQLTGEPIKDNVMIIDFDPRTLQQERVHIFEHQLLFLNPHEKYLDDKTPDNYKDWLNLFRYSINNKINISLNLKNKGIAKTVDIINYDNLDPTVLYEMKIAESRKAMIKIVREEGFGKGIKKGEEIGIKKGEEIGIKKGEEIGIKKGEKIGIKKGEKIGIKKGEELGKKKGKDEEKLTVAKIMKQNGEQIEKIMTYTGLSKEEIENISI